MTNKINIYALNPNLNPDNLNVGYSEERIIKYIKEKKWATAQECYKLSSKRSEPLNHLLKKKVVIISKIEKLTKKQMEPHLKEANAIGDREIEIYFTMLQKGIPADKINEIVKAANQKYYSD